MNRIDKSIEQIRLFPNSQVDCGTEQGSDVFFSHLHKHLSVPEMLDLPFDWYVAETKRCLIEIQDTINPYSLPEDYLFFLKYFGGITISNENYYFASLGFGPMVNEWYSYLIDDGFYKNGFLNIGFLRFRKSNNDTWKHIDFFLDIGNIIQRNSVIEVFDWKLGNLGFQDLFNEPQTYPQYWSKIADSFIHWLELTANTGGSFNYLNNLDV